VREQLQDIHGETGRLSIDPELLLRILLLGYLYGVTCERKLVEELRMHPAWRWFTGLGFDQEIPHHASSTAVYKDNVQSYDTVEPAIDLTASSFLTFAWQIAGAPSSTP